MPTTVRGPDPIQPSLPLEFAPAELRAHGLADAHVRPLVGVRRREDDSVRCVGRREPAVAWADFAVLEWLRSGNTFAALGVDCDSRESRERLAAASMGAGDVPTPNLAIYRKRSGHALAVYTLRTPVHRGEGARPVPLQALGRVSEWLREALDGDPGFTGVLAANPEDGGYETAWLRMPAYTLRELSDRIPKGWRRPAWPTTDAGRNCAVFGSLLRFAARPERTEAEIWIEAERLRGLFDTLQPHVFTRAELRGVVRSVLRYRAGWAARGWHRPDFRERQARRGKASGLARFWAPACVERERPWEAEGVHRATWYRRRARARRRGESGEAKARGESATRTNTG